MSIIFQRSDKEILLMVKGASEMVLESCTKWHDPSTNRIEILSNTTKEKINDSIKKMANSSLRTLCLAYKPVRAD